MQINNVTESALLTLAENLGQILHGNELIELVGDVGAGKTTFTRGLAKGLGVVGDIQSPTFTISRLYEVPGGKRLAHYDFYRLQDAGILAMEIEESINDGATVTVIEWGEIVSGVLPQNRITIYLTADSENERDVRIVASGDAETKAIEGLA